MMSHNSHPLVSVIIPAYNMADLTAKTVESVLSQTYSNLDIIIVDDGSTDHTKERMAEFGDRIQYILKENGGACSARNLGIRHSKGDFIALLDCDDIYNSKKIEKSVDFLNKHMDYGYVHTNAIYIDEEDNVVRERGNAKSRVTGWIKDKLILSNFVCNSTVVLRKNCLDKSGVFDEKLFPPADWDLWLRLSEHYKVGYIDEPLTKYRIVSQGCLGDLERTREECLIVLGRFFERNKKIGVFIKMRAYSNYHLSMAECYLLKQNRTRMKEEFVKAVESFPLNLKAMAILFYYLFAQKSLIRRLRKMIEFKDGE